MSLHIDGVSLVRDGIVHLGGVEAKLERGKLTVVIGRTLAGKTTLMRVLAGLQCADEGRLTVDDKTFSGLPAWRRDVAMVYQQFINYPHLSVFDNVAFPLRRRGLGEGDLCNRVTAVLAKVGLDGFEARRPSQLSGGQQQRVALARALAREARILLLDEPLVNLDYKLREQLREEFRGLFADQQRSIVVYNTTEPAEAMMLGDHVLVMHEGRLLQSGTPAEIFDRPASTTVATIVNDPPMSIVRGEIGGGMIRLGAGVSLTLPDHMRTLSPGPCQFGVRANDLGLAATGGIPGKLGFSEVSGSETFLYVETSFGALTLQIEGVQDFALGSIIPVEVPAARLFAFSAAGDLLAAP